MDRWMPGAVRVETAAQGGYGVAPGEMRATAIVHHVMEGWLSTMIQWAQERPPHHEASYHFGIGVDGRIVQFVPLDDPAWHVGRRDEGNDPTWTLWDPRRNPGGHTIGVAREGFHADPWTPQQIEAAIAITAWAMRRHEIEPSTETLIGHFELNPVTRAQDPGGGWDRDAMLAAIRSDALPEIPAPMQPPEVWRVLADAFAPAADPTRDTKFAPAAYRVIGTRRYEVHELLVEVK
jgi:N-acetyl-anhydromuramyl-L-alanine amidase AmpD